MNWQLMSYGCALISTAIATAYETLGEDGLTHSLNEPNCVAVFTNAELLPTLLKVLPNTPTVRIVIYDGEPSAELMEKLRAVREMTVISIDALREKGKALSQDEITSRAPKPDTVACIMYTSGSTGAPKGVVITNGNLVASIGAVRTLLGQHFLPGDTFLAYLPLAHILEYIVEMCMLFLGLTTGFGRVKTLTDASVRNCQGDIAAFKPSIMIGVPAVWELIRKGIIGKVQAGGKLKKSVFNAAIGIKKANVPVLAGVVDKAILSGVRAATGGRLRLAMSGGAALSKETQEFLTTALVTVLQGKPDYCHLSVGSGDVDCTLRLWYDRVMRNVRYPPSRGIPLRISWSPSRFYRDQTPLRTRTRVRFRWFSSSGRSMHSRAFRHQGIL